MARRATRPSRLPGVPGRKYNAPTGRKGDVMGIRFAETFIAEVFGKEPGSDPLLIPPGLIFRHMVNARFTGQTIQPWTEVPVEFRFQVTETPCPVTAAQMAGKEGPFPDAARERKTIVLGYAQARWSSAWNALLLPNGLIPDLAHVTLVVHKLRRPFQNDGACSLVLLGAEIAP
jgi:hypothetical protein